MIALPQISLAAQGTTPRAARAAEKLQNPSPSLSAEDATDFRGLAARANYLALDRPDAAYATKELCRCFAQPNTDAMTALEHLVRYLCR